MASPSKIVSLDTALSVVQDGMTLGIGGWIFHGQPMALVRGLIRKGVRDLTLVPAPGSIAPDMLIGAGCVKTAGVRVHQLRASRARAEFPPRGAIGRDQGA